MEIIVDGNNIEKALRLFKRGVKKEGLLRELKKRHYYEKPSVKKRRKQREAQRLRRKNKRSE